MRVLHATIAFAVVLGLAGAASAQSLGELAEKEKQKRQGKPAPKTITEADLARAGKRGTLSMSGSSEEAAAPAEGGAEAAPAEAAPAESTEAAEGGQAEGTPPAEQKPAAKPKGPPPKSEDQIRAEKTAEMQKKLDLARENVVKHQKTVDDLQTALNQTAGLYSPQRADAIKRLEDEKQAVAKAQAEIVQLEEDIRRSAWPR